MNREIIITCTADKAFPSTAFAGYAGEHLATTLIWKLPDELISEDYTYRLDFATASNSYIAHIGSDLSFALPQALTIAGTLAAQLTISNKTEEVVYKTQAIKLTIKESIEAIEEVDDKYVGLLDEKLNDFQTVLDRLGILDVTELRGISKIEKTATNGLIDTYTIYYSDGTTSDFTIANGKDGKNGIDGKDGADGKDGTDYVLTDDDKSAIAQLVYEDYIADLNNLLENRLAGGATNG
jgi:hypothetical protein